MLVNYIDADMIDLTEHHLLNEFESSLMFDT